MSLATKTVCHPGSVDEAATPIYFGNGCFWGRQKDFTDVEKRMGRKPEELSAIVGYAGGRKGAGVYSYSLYVIPLALCSVPQDGCMCNVIGQLHAWMDTVAAIALLSVHSCAFRMWPSEAMGSEWCL